MLPRLRRDAERGDEGLRRAQETRASSLPSFRAMSPFTTRISIFDMQSILVVRPSGARRLLSCTRRLASSERPLSNPRSAPSFRISYRLSLTNNSICFFLQMIAAARIVFYQSLYLSFYYSRQQL
jgi:hypothetical protein